jgi:calcineurin-like phosphoesterase
MKYLGIYFDNRLIFHTHTQTHTHTHTEHVTGKSRKMIYMLGKTAKLNSGLGHKSLKTIYEEVLVPLMTYGAPVGKEAIKKTKTLSEDAEDPKTD